MLDGPANSPDLNPIEDVWGIVKRMTRDTRPNNADKLKSAVQATWASITKNLYWSCNITEILNLGFS